jgi:hypothetical protein
MRMIKGFVVMTDEELGAIEKGFDFSLKSFGKFSEPDDDNEDEEDEEGIKLNCFYGSIREDHISGIFESSLVVNTEKGESPCFLLVVGGQTILFAPDDKGIFKAWF